MIVLVGIFILIIILQQYRLSDKIEGMRWGNVAFHPRRGRGPYHAPNSAKFVLS